MGQMNQEPKAQGAPQRRLNIIYFIDSAKTRSMTISLGKFKLIISLIFLVLVWFFASFFVIGWLGREQIALVARLKASLTTIFEYQSRFDNVYEAAYPPATPRDEVSFDPAPAGLRAEDYLERQAAESPGASTPGGELPQAAVPPPAPPPQAEVPSSSPAGPEVAAASDALKDSSETKSTTAPPGDLTVTVDNATLERGSNFVSLHFELANRSTHLRAEGYIWAVAEFIGEDGQKIFLGAPRHLKLNAGGDPSNPAKATYFGIKRFKKQSFNFPIPKGRPGTFTAVRIVVMDLTGEHRKAYRLTTELRVH